MGLWLRDGKLLVDGSGRPIVCATCPCEGGVLCTARDCSQDPPVLILTIIGIDYTTPPVVPGEYDDLIGKQYTLHYRAPGDPCNLSGFACYWANCTDGYNADHPVYVTIRCRDDGSGRYNVTYVSGDDWSNTLAGDTYPHADSLVLIYGGGVFGFNLVVSIDVPSTSSTNDFNDDFNDDF